MFVSLPKVFYCMGVVGRIIGILVLRAGRICGVNILHLGNGNPLPQTVWNDSTESAKIRPECYR